MVFWGCDSFLNYVGSIKRSASRKWTEMPNLWGDTLSNSQMGLFPIGWQFLSWIFDRHAAKYLDTHWEMHRAGLKFYLGISQSVPLFFKHHDTDFSCFSQRVTSTLEVLLRGSPKAIRRISQHVLIYILAIPPHFL
jgi:hypothetical protein